MASDVQPFLPVVYDNSVDALNYLRRTIEDALQKTATEIAALQTGTGLATTGSVPSNVPVPTGITTDATHEDGSMSVVLTIDSYVQGAVAADALLLFISEGTAPLAAATAISATAAIPFSPDRTIFRLEGLNPANNYRFCIAASRWDGSVYQVGALQCPASGPDWSDITGGTPNYTGDINGTAASTVVTNAANGQTSFGDTTTFRSNNGPTNNPVPSAITSSVNPDGSARYELTFTYTQGALPATYFAFFWDELDGEPAESAEHHSFDATASPIKFVLDGLPSDKIFSFGIAAGRVTADGLQHLNAIQSSTSSPDWQGITQGTAEFTANIGTAPNAAANDLVNPSFEDNSGATFYGWVTGVSGAMVDGWSQSATAKYGTYSAKNIVTSTPASAFSYIESYNEIDATAGKVVPASPSQQWRVSAWGHRESVTGTPENNLQLREYDSSGVFLRQSQQGWASGGTFGWTQQTLDVTTGASCAYLGVRITQEGDSSTQTFRVDGVQLVQGATLPSFDDDFQASVSARQVAQGTILNVVLASLGANINAITAATWTDVLSGTICIDHDATSQIIILEGKFGAEVSNMGGGDSLTVQWRILRNGTAIWTSHTTLSSQDGITDVPSLFHADTTPTANGVTHEYRLQIRYDNISGSSAVLDVETPGNLLIQSYATV